MGDTILGIIPARSGSKGVKNKNTRDLFGKPLIDYTIQDARDCNVLTDYLVSTDSERIAKVAASAGAPVPFIRPDELATDEASSVAVVQHAIREYEERNDVWVNVAVLLQPTTPLRSPKDIDNAVGLFRGSDASSLVSCYSTKDAHPNHMFIHESADRLTALRNQDDTPNRRQDFEVVYLLNGAVYICTRELVMEQNKICSNNPLGYVMPRDRSVNIDEEFDFRLAELLLQQNIDHKV